MASHDQESRAIAIVGMAGRFPGAPDLDTYWRNLLAGREGISRFTDEALRASGVPDAELRDPGYVKANGLLDGVELFDASFFGFTPLEAEITDPQHRLFLETAWQALEDAGHHAHAFEGRIGVFAGAGASTYLIHHLLARPDVLARVGSVQLSIGNNKDYVPTRVSYKLDLRGPSISVNTACSSSLVAVHLACQSLLDYHADLVLAGGVGIQVPQDVGYQFVAGGIASPDGQCRPFDAKAQGTVSGNGVGVVVLRRLADAIADGDDIRAVILGSAVNNDGAAKVGYTAPSVAGQAEVIAEAMAVADVDPGTIQYVEAHGTGTIVGDPIEITALTQAFRMRTDRAGFCAIGSVKSNIGHLDEAAGVAGLIKTVLALQHGQLPPSLHYESPNPAIDFASSPFFVNATARPWPADGPRRAGVSAFGIGGTNAHVVLEEAPRREAAAAVDGPQLLTVSAKTATALQQRCRDLAAQLRTGPELRLADVAWTLQQGRRAFDHRAAVVASDAREAVHLLETAVTVHSRSERTPHVVFLFPGQGAQHPGMAAALYEHEPVYRETLDRCAAVLQRETGIDIRIALRDAGDSALAETAVAQCALFAIEYALAQLWRSWGVEPHAMLGHSLGELVAATVAGVFDLDDALRLVALRGRLMQALPRGAMLAVPLAESELQRWLDDQLSIAAVNTAARCVVSGSTDAVARLEQRLAAAGIDTKRLETSHAFHSAAMEPMLGEFRAAVARVERHAPARPWMSNVTGRSITAAEATDPGYWASHVRQPVRFRDAARVLLADRDAVFLEVGPGRTLASLVRQQPECTPERVIVSSLPHAGETVSDRQRIAEVAGRLWTGAVSLDWRGLHRGEPRARVALPTYPFERQRYWIDRPRGSAAGAEPAASLAKRSDVADWFYVPSWRRTAPPVAPLAAAGEWIVLCDAAGIGAGLASALRGAGHVVAEASADDTVASALRRTSSGLLRIVDCSLLGDTGPVDPLNHTFALAREVARASRRVELIVVADASADVTGEEPFEPAKCAAAAALTVLAQERAEVRARWVDVSGWRLQDSSSLTRTLAGELLGGADAEVAWRNGYRWVRTFEAAALSGTSAAAIRRGGAYLITGGLGGVGLILAEHLATRYGARLALVSRPKRQVAVDRIVTAAARAMPVRTIADYPDLERTIDRLCGSYALALAANAGMDTRPGAAFDTSELKRRLTVGRPLQRMCEYLGSVLAEEGLVEESSGRVVFSARAARTPAPDDLHREAIDRYPEFAGTFDLLRHCVTAYPEALSGRVPAISVLYPGGEPVLLEQAAARTVAHSTRDGYIRAVRDLLVEQAAAHPGRRLRVLEVGVGDGMLAGVVAPALAGLDVEYHATDIGRSFVSRAQSAAAQAGLSHMMRFATLDISRDPAAQGFAPGSFDVVLALDVLHATPDLRETLDHVRALLAPGGIAGVIETVHPPRWVHFIWGLAEGWWAFRDPLRCRQSPLLSLDEWTAAFSDRGFAQVSAWPAADTTRASDYGLIVAYAAGSGEGTHAERTVHRLRAAGADVLLLEADVADADAIAAAVAETRRTFGALDGVIHAAGETQRELLVNAIDETGEAQLSTVLRPKVAGTQSLASALKDVPLDFVLLVSSNASVLGGLGLSAYSVASRYLDAFATAQRRQGDHRWISSNWDGWPTEAAGGFDSGFRTSIDRFAMSLDECQLAFERVVGSGLPQVVVSSGDLAERRRRWVDPPAPPGAEETPVPAASAAHDRPDIRTAFEAPRTAAEREIARIWEELLGIHRIGIDDVFADLGGDSLLGTQLIARVERSLGQRLPFRALFEAPTIRQQAALIEGPAPAVPVTQAIPRIADQATHALSHAQRRLWVLSQLDGSAAYNIPLHQRLEGPLDLPALERALSRLADRHETLRTRIVTIDGEPRQRIEPPAAIVLPVIDLSSRPDAEAEALRLAQQDAAAPFDLERAPGWRVALIRLAAERYVLLLTFHHIASDGVSIALLGRDLAACYGAAITGQAPRLPELRIQYRDFAAWQQGQLEGGDVEAHRRFWRDALAGELPVLELPLDAPRPATQTFVGRERGWHLQPQDAARVTALARAQNVSLFMLLSAAVTLLLHRYSGQRDIIIGSPVAGRTHPDLDNQVGFYLNMLPLRSQVDPSMRFADFLQRVRTTATAAYDHQAYPLDRLILDLNVPRDLSRSPLFDVIVILQNQQESELALPGLRATAMFDHNGTSKADLTFNFKESTHGLAIGIEYNTDLFAADRVERAGGHLLTLLAEMVRDPQQVIGDIDLLSAEERHTVAAVNQTGADYPEDATVLDLIRTMAAEAPDRVACRCGDAQLTRAQLQERAARVTSFLAGRGVGRGDRVGIHLERSIDLLPAVLGVLGAGAAYVPLDPAFPADRLRLMADDAAVKLVLTETVIAEAASAPASVIPRRPGPRDLAYTIYTSGSTGRPKGVAIEHRSLVNFLCSMQRRPGLSGSDTLVAVTTLSFDIAGLELFLPLVAGATVVIATREQASDGRLLQALLRESRATAMQATPATWQLLIESGWQGDAALTVLCGGEALPLELAGWLAARCRRVWNLYGPTETTIWSSVLDVTATVGAKGADGARGGVAGILPIGSPIANTSLYVLDARLQPQLAGVPGELYIGGDGLARGYVGLPDLTADRFMPDPFATRPGARMYRTGDRALRRADGMFEFLGRLDDQIKLRGHRIEIGEIENALLAHPQVARAAVVLDQAASGARLLAGVVRQPGIGTTDDEVIGELRQHLRAALPEYMVPSAFVFLDDLPRTPNGKVDRRALRTAVATAVAAHVPSAPGTPLERRIAGIWADVLGLELVGADTDFFMSGGHSLTAARLAFRLGEELGVAFTLMDVFQHPTVAAQAAVAATRPAADRDRGTSSAGPIPIAPLTADELDMLNE